MSSTGSFGCALAADVEQVDAAALLRVAAHLGTAGAPALASIDAERLEAAFAGAVEAFRDPDSPERRRLDPDLRRNTQLSQACLDASLDALLDGFSRFEVRAVLARAARAGSATAESTPERSAAGGALRSRRRPPSGPDRTPASNGSERRARGSGAASAAPHLIVLAGDLPGLLLQPLLASLAVRRPVLVKSSSREPFFAPAFAAALAAREPALADAIAAVAWPGGAAAIEDGLHQAVDRVVAYGSGEAIAALRRRAAERLVAFGPKASVAIVAGAAPRRDLPRIAAGLARDVALFEQRGCLSLQAIYTDGDADALADAVAGALDEASHRWPPPPLSDERAAALRLLREEAAFLGCRVTATALERGTVIVDRDSAFRPSPGQRTVRIHPVPDPEAALEALRAAAGRLQGAALAGAGAAALSGGLRALGVSYLCEPGRLQSPGATWANGGIDLVEELSGSRSGRAWSRGSPSRRR
ncbi:MAG TPA: acyl-CoA reductase [Thermoanaerobaculia bacterium]|nr:acyl-CoA reductase [Thermoanaerobaculia bacterium]